MEDRTKHSKYLFKNFTLPEDYYSPIIIADNLKTPENLGNVLRLADNIQTKKVLFVDSEPNLRLSKVKKTASSSFNSVDWEFCSLSELNHKIPSGYTLVGIETTSDSVNVFDYDLPQKVAFVIGNEVSGISDELLDICNKIVHIPVFGKNTSLNVSHALAVVLFHWQSKIF